ncbi:helix-turn-helix transcriptional regulator [Anaerobutyricum soehngenii]|uniref:Helix-turn-helix transcriptional regulator n=2 Tax=Anaerobutyricum soehngenii TaxID=105843 RepID=A0ABS3ZIZ6_9FIRM|nr:helix-turn-helix transcriptional regulator [Anaerobutyricum soehngenii]
MLPEIDFEKIGQRVKQARIDKGYTQAELGEIIGCSNNHMSHIETGQTKVSLSLLLKLSYALDTDLNFFLMDTPYLEKESIIDSEIADKLSHCSPSTLLSVNKIIDILLEQQERDKKPTSYY